MPKIDWTALPLHVKRHLIERLREPEITQADLEALKFWIATDPEVPDGPWWKDFGSFKLAGEGRAPKTFLTRGQAAFGKQIQCPASLRSLQRRSTGMALAGVGQTDGLGASFQLASHSPESLGNAFITSGLRMTGDGFERHRLLTSDIQVLARITDLLGRPGDFALEVAAAKARRSARPFAR